jgi:hypothetical protein
MSDDSESVEEPSAVRQAELHAAWLAAQTSNATAPAKTPSDPARLPAIVAALGYGGLVPFIVFAAAASQGDTHADLSRAALFAYAAVILSFVGALHWGFAMTAPGLDARQRAHLYRWSVVPALLAWPALLVYAKPAMLLLIVGFVAQYRQDRRLAKQAGREGFLPAWYLPLRLRLSVVACAGIAFGGLWNGG